MREYSNLGLCSKFLLNHFTAHNAHFVVACSPVQPTSGLIVVECMFEMSKVEIPRKGGELPTLTRQGTCNYEIINTSNAEFQTGESVATAGFNLGY
jgi:hypothetical protein